MDYFQPMRVFAKVVELGSFSRTSLRLNIAPAATTRHIAELKSHVGIRLLNRTTRHAPLTEAGQEYLQRVLQILGDVWH